MAALLHQAAPQPPHPNPYPHHPWINSFPATYILSPRRAASSKRRGTPTRRLHAAGNGSGVGTPAADSSKKTSRKEKQRQQRRLREREEQQQLLLKESLVEAAREEDSGGNDDDELPQEVFDRILKRILFTVGIPMASGVALLNVYDALRRGRGVEVPSWVELLTILLSFGTSALGIAYGTLSASWDPEKEGSLLGIDEARTNWPELWKEETEKDEKK